MKASFLIFSLKLWSVYLEIKDWPWVAWLNEPIDLADFKFWFKEFHILGKTTFGRESRRFDLVFSNLKLFVLFCPESGVNIFWKEIGNLECMYLNIKTPTLRQNKSSNFKMFNLPKTGSVWADLDLIETVRIALFCKVFNLL